MMGIIHELIPSKKSTPLSGLPATPALAGTKCGKVFLPVALHDF